MQLHAHPTLSPGLYKPFLGCTGSFMVIDLIVTGKKFHMVEVSLLLDPNTYSLAPFHSSLRNIVVRFCVKYLRLNLVIFSVVSISHFRLEQIWKFRFI